MVLNTEIALGNIQRNCRDEPGRAVLIPAISQFWSRLKINKADDSESNPRQNMKNACGLGKFHGADLAETAFMTACITACCLSTMRACHFLMAS